jgi:hypothetical protein
MFIFGGNVVGDDGTIIAASPAVVAKDIQSTNVSSTYTASCANFKTNFLGFLVSPVPFDPCEIEILGRSTIYTHLLDSSKRAFPGLNQTLHNDLLDDPTAYSVERRRENDSVDPSSFEPRVALVLGNANYKEYPLQNPLNDAYDMAQALRSLRFDVIEIYDATKQQIDEALRTFYARAQQAKVGLFYYAGHAKEYEGMNYLIPLSSRNRNSPDLKEETVGVQEILKDMIGSQTKESQTKLNIMIIDACRTPKEFRNRRDSEGGLTSVIRPRRFSTLIALSTQPGSIADDMIGNRNGIFTKYLLQYLKQPGLDLHDFFDKVGYAVLQETKGIQEPWVNSSPLPRFCFAGCR